MLIFQLSPRDVANYFLQGVEALPCSQPL
jgi:hypothetical protein